MSRLGWDYSVEKERVALPLRVVVRACDEISGEHGASELEMRFFCV
jgi:hypothetical protein